ncbi:hypothetical protein [Wenjunlia tyrosinilytica]|uniref:Uncharacterized protein n=1 Tax=Wenjunlia tyrosinilytica TaxID=1544741 RepID=A0A917ZAV9_9ACTN|nr:hypothetical protein [Wenjunlia tyrosinilytica]GGO79925.1 hypothetical protein GCM10012280_00580 [Wenjunlia tyrosinilytica]
MTAATTETRPAHTPSAHTPPSRTTAAHTTPADYPMVDVEWGEDPLTDIPRELLERRGAMDADTAGGCG